MRETKSPSTVTLLMMISFASVNAVLFTPSLPDIAHFFGLSADSAQMTMTWYLVGYTLGQLVYGPLANRLGRKPALYLGVGTQIISSLLCVVSGIVHYYWLLVFGRFLLALGAGVGLKMTFTLVNECYSPKIASQKIAYLTLAFAITPALSVAIGGILNANFGWISCFYAGAFYGLALLSLIPRLPETQLITKKAFEFDTIIKGYRIQFTNGQLLAGGLLMGLATAFVYIFAALAPFVAMNLFKISSVEYGIENLLPALGLVLGSLTSAQITKKLSLTSIVKLGICVTFIGVMLMCALMALRVGALYALFLPMMLIYFGLSFIMANASTHAMSHTSDKSNGSAVMNFINMGTATIAVLSLGFFTVQIMLLPLLFFCLASAMIIIYKRGLSKHVVPL